MKKTVANLVDSTVDARWNDNLEKSNITKNNQGLKLETNF